MTVLFFIEERNEAVASIKVWKAISLDEGHPSLKKIWKSESILKSTNMPALLKGTNIIPILKQKKRTQNHSIHTDILPC